MLIIGITGTLGAGKGTIVDYLIQQQGFVHYSVRAFLIDIIKAKNLPVNRDNMVVVANELRANHSPSYIVEELYKQAKQSGKNCIIESVRAVGEVEALKELDNFSLLAIDADPQIRYSRIVARQSETDQVSFETFMDNEKREMTSDDPAKQNLSKCIAMADYVLHNNSDLSALYAQIDEIIEKQNLSTPVVKN